MMFRVTRWSSRSFPLLGIVPVLLLGAGGEAVAQTVVPAREAEPDFLVPQARLVAPGGEHVRVEKVDARIAVVQGIATTTLDISLVNPTPRPREARMLVPIPSGAVVRGFSLGGGTGTAEARLLPREDARTLYESIVRRLRDPALLEFAGHGALSSSVFPVPQGESQSVRVVYEEVLSLASGRVDYVLPRTAHVSYDVPWTIEAEIRSNQPIATVYSPSHSIAEERSGPGKVRVRLAAHAERDPGSFRLSWLPRTGELSSSVFAYPEEDGGVFLLLASVPDLSKRAPLDDVPRIPRDVTIVIDRSGSMRGEKLLQAKNAARQVLSGLEDGETFRLIAYSDTIDVFSSGPVVKDRDSLSRTLASLDSIEALSGTNLHDALVECLREAPPDGALPIVLFLTDGLPTVGVTAEPAIREVVVKANPHAKRVFTFGVGFDVNTPLLDRIAKESRARPTFVLPGEDVEVAVSDVFRRLEGPVLASPTLRSMGAEDTPAPERVSDVLPRELPDFFAGDEVVVLGKYRGAEPLAFELAGNHLGRERVFRIDVPLASASTRNDFVPRLWASRKIGALVEAIRDLEAAPAGTGAALAATALAANAAAGSSSAGVAMDPRLRELVDEVVYLSSEYGILTEYTAFLAREGSDLALDAATATATSNLIERALECRVGEAAVNQALNQVTLREQQSLNLRNRYLNERLESVEVATVQQICDRAFWRRGERWVEGRLILRAERAEPTRVVEAGTPEYRELVARLGAAGREGILSLGSEILLEVDGETVLVRLPAPAGEESGEESSSVEPASPSPAE